MLNPLDLVGVCTAMLCIALPPFAACWAAKLPLHTSCVLRVVYVVSPLVGLLFELSAGLRSLPFGSFRRSGLWAVCSLALALPLCGVIRLWRKSHPNTPNGHNRSRERCTRRGCAKALVVALHALTLAALLAAWFVAENFGDLSPEQALWHIQQLAADTKEAARPNGVRSTPKGLHTEDTPGDLAEPDEITRNLIAGFLRLYAALGSLCAAVHLAALRFLRNPPSGGLWAFGPLCFAAFRLWRRLHLGVVLGSLGPQGACGADFVAAHYVVPPSGDLLWPKGATKRNLILVVAEALENTLADRESGGVLDANAIPFLSQIALEGKYTLPSGNIHEPSSACVPRNSDERVGYNCTQSVLGDHLPVVHFSATPGRLGGATQLGSTSWSIAALWAMLSGLPLRQYSRNTREEIAKNEVPKGQGFVPGARTMLELLLEAGYDARAITGCRGAFAGNDRLFRTHGVQKIADRAAMGYRQLIESPDPLLRKHTTCWGVHDYVLFDYALDAIANASRDANGRPFAAMMFTVDTHSPAGHPCRLCPRPEDQKAKAPIGDNFARQIRTFRCLDNQLRWFLGNLTHRLPASVLRNTTIAIVGDHYITSKAPAELWDAHRASRRGVYNAIINPAPEVLKGLSPHRVFSQLDMFPTILASLGGSPGKALGLGANLFAHSPQRKTLLESLGTQATNNALASDSEFLVRVATGLPPEEDTRCSRADGHRPEGGVRVTANATWVPMEKATATHKGMRKHYRTKAPKGFFSKKRSYI